MACTRGLVDVVKYLLTCGYPDVNSRNCTQLTPLHAAVTSGNCEVVECLLRAGAVVDPMDASGIYLFLMPTQAGF